MYQERKKRPQNQLVLSYKWLLLSRNKDGGEERRRKACWRNQRTQSHQDTWGDRRKYEREKRFGTTFISGKQRADMWRRVCGWVGESYRWLGKWLLSRALKVETEAGAVRAPHSQLSQNKKDSCSAEVLAHVRQALYH